MTNDNIAGSVQEEKSNWRLIRERMASKAHHLKPTSAYAGDSSLVAFTRQTTLFQTRIMPQNERFYFSLPGSLTEETRKRNNSRFPSTSPSTRGFNARRVHIHNQSQNTLTTLSWPEHSISPKLTGISLEHLQSRWLQLMYVFRRNYFSTPEHTRGRDAIPKLRPDPPVWYMVSTMARLSCNPNSLSILGLLTWLKPTQVCVVRVSAVNFRRSDWFSALAPLTLSCLST